MEKPKLIVIAGPTAVGKTKYAIEYAKKHSGEIVSLDSVQVYKYLNIGSAKPKIEEMQGIRHYMIDEVEPDVNLNVKEFKDMANGHILEILAKGKLPILVGGTGFYIRAVLYDTDFLYEDEEEAKNIRLEIENEIKLKGIDYIYDELRKVDEESTMIIPKENERRVVRALQFYRLHRFPISYHNKLERNKESKYDYEYLALNMDREKLYNNIDNRVDKMIKDGLLVEVKELIDRGLTKDLNSMNSIGYKELYDFCKKRNKIYDINTLDEESKKELDIIIDLIKMHSRNYAKRQLTWFRAEKNIKWI